jgi:A/G-specific adenine glycosylase
MHLQAPEIAEIQQRLLGWYAGNARVLPWRLTRDPYRILVSEVMLQQTQVDRVIPYYERWLELFPTVDALAAAPTRDVISAWAGLGYNRRAVNLQRTARAVVETYAGEFPRTVPELIALPGIGPYTAGAIAAFAFEQDVAFVDTNMRRVVHRLAFGSDLPAPLVDEKEIVAAAGKLLPEGHGWVWNQALIEFGAIQCTRRKPACVICPLQDVCAAFPTIQSDAAAIPVGTRLKNEGVFEGSNRQYRGRLINALRRSHRMSVGEIGPAIKDDFTPADAEWLRELIGGLRRDGLVVLAEESPDWDSSAVVSLPE